MPGVTYESTFQGVTFDRAAWDANQERMHRERFYTDHYRGQLSPWVILPVAGDGR